MNNSNMTLEELDRLAYAKLRAGMPEKEVRDWFESASRKYRIKNSISILREIDDE